MSLSLRKFAAAALAAAISFGAAAEQTLKVGTEPTFPPFEYIDDQDKSNVIGFDIDIINAIAKAEGFKVEIVKMPFDGLIPALLTSQLDAAIAGMTINDERKEKVNFSDPYFDAIQFVLVPKDSDIKTTDDFTGKKIGTQKGTTGDYLVQDMDGVEDVQYDKGIQAVQDLVAGRLDAVILDKNPVETFAAQYPDDLKALDGADFNFDTESYGIVLPKDDQPLTDAVNKAIKDLKDDGTYQKLIDQYFNN